MDSIVLTGVFTLGGVLLGFILTQAAMIYTQNRENTKKIRLFYQQLTMLSFVANELESNAYANKEPSEIQSFYKRFNIPIKIKELSNILMSIDFSNGENIDIYLNFEILRHDLANLDEIFSERWLFLFSTDQEKVYSELVGVCNSISDGTTALTTKIEVAYLKECWFIYQLKTLYGSFHNKVVNNPE
ncbi:hypothetical protein ABH15_10005 [Methanoculleus taiwanensis]|uniref:Uncharacterized protein n=1 Tax=Methanoculleus taiwanensis TaxID=1550565 RepID=A0A498H1E1_9EURY|nr:hypothetical protein [Methanoculleus taiwanensis]RXE56408.1 hypothetical protein ABH15_10005 [Methanoculleus taiwanensis]